MVARVGAGVVAERPTRGRVAVAGLLFVTVVINYLDRSNLAITAPAIRAELGLDPARMGLVLSAFGWTYALCQIPGGWLVDRVSPRALYAALIALWSAATLALALPRGVTGLVIVRLLIGVLEAPSYPINNRVATTWFPERERATAIGVYASGQFVGVAFLTVAFLTPVLAWIQAAATRADFARVLTSRKLWGVYVGQFALTSTLWFFLTWFPTYLVGARGMAFARAGVLASLPFLAACAGVLCSGVLSDFLLRRGASLGTARKVPVVTGLLLSTSLVGANFVDAPALVIGFLALAFFGNGLASITWSLVSAIAPARLLGLAGGVFNFVGNLSGATVPLVVGYLARDYGFAAGLTYVAALALLGALSYVFVVGRVERVAEG